jgi:hypothetical protein
LYFVEESSSTVTATPVAVVKVKLDVDLELTMPVEPPSDGPATGPAVGVGAAAGTDDERSAAEDVPAPASPVTAHVSPTATSHAPFLFDSNRRALGRRSCTAVVAGADPAGEWLDGL